MRGVEEGGSRSQSKEGEEEAESAAPAPPSPATSRSPWTPPDELSPGSAGDDDDEEPPACSDAGIQLVTVHETSTSGERA